MPDSAMLDPETAASDDESVFSRDSDESDIDGDELVDEASEARAGDGASHASLKKTKARKPKPTHADVLRLEQEDVEASSMHTDEAALVTAPLCHKAPEMAQHLPAGSPLHKLWRDIEAIWPGVGPLVRECVHQVNAILLLAITVRRFRTAVHNFCLRNLRFFQKLALQEKRQGRHTTPGTLESLVASSLLSNMKLFQSKLEQWESLTQEWQWQNRAEWEESLRLRANDADTLIRATHMEVPMGKLAPLLIGAHPHTRPLETRVISKCYTDATVQTADAADLDLRRQPVITELVTTLPRIYPWISAITAQQLPDAVDAHVNEGMPDGEEGVFVSVSRRELQLESLKFEDQEAARRWRDDAWWELTGFATSIDAGSSFLTKPSALFGLQRMLLVCVQTDILVRLSAFAEIVAIALRHEFAFAPSMINTWRLAHALLLLAHGFDQSRKPELGIQAATEAVRLLESICDAGSDGMRTALASAKLQLATTLRTNPPIFVESDAHTLAIDTARLRQARRYSAQAVQLWRERLHRAPTDWNSQLALGIALLARWRLQHDDFEPLTWRTRNIMELLHVESTECFQQVAQAHPELGEPILARSFRQRSEYLPTRLVDRLSDYDKALEIYQRWATDWPRENLRWIVEMHSARGDILLKLHRNGDAAAAFTQGIEIGSLLGSYSEWMHLMRAKASFKLGSYDCAMRDVDVVFDLLGPDPSETLPSYRSALVLKGICMWMTEGDDAYAEALSFVERGVHIYRSVADVTPTSEDYILGLCWFAALRCADDGLLEAKSHARRALELVQKQKSSEFLPRKACLAQSLLFSAAVLFEADEWHEAKAHISQAADLIREGRTAARQTDEPTRKTIWLLLAHILRNRPGAAEEEDEHGQLLVMDPARAEEIAVMKATANQARREARKLGCVGFFHRLGISGIQYL
ncbi:hypothetical protein OC844_005273 [Tilletia horrida]|nr:hypothetical protein OC844_005273 [Tilletia horrida]